MMIRQACSEYVEVNYLNKLRVKYGILLVLIAQILSRCTVNKTLNIHYYFNFYVIILMLIMTQIL